MSLGKVHAISTVKSDRTRLLEQERLANDAARAERLNAPIKAQIEKATREASLSAGKLLAEELRHDLQTVRYDLTHGPSPEFVAQDYDGRWKNAQEVTDGITAAYNAFKARTADEDVKLTYEFLSHNWQKADTSRLEVWEAAYQFCLRKLKAVEDKYAAPAPEPVPVVPISKMDQTIRDLERHIAECPPGERLEELERKLHRYQVRCELLGQNDVYTQTMQELVDYTGKSLSEENSLKLKSFLASPLNRKRFTNDRTGIRLAAAEFFGDDSFLDENEWALVERNRNIEGYTSEQVKQLIGSAPIVKRPFEG
jgi:hypothetical protein